MTKIHYDIDYDILYIESDNPGVAEYEPITDDVYVRVTSDGKKIGALIFDYSQKDKAWLNEVLPTELFERVKRYSQE